MWILDDSELGDKDGMGWEDELHALGDKDTMGW